MRLELSPSVDSATSDSENHGCNKFAKSRSFPELITLWTENMAEAWSWNWSQEVALANQFNEAFCFFVHREIGTREGFCETKAFSGYSWEQKIPCGKKCTKDQYRNQYRHSSSAAPAQFPTVGHAFKNSLITWECGIIARGWIATKSGVWRWYFHLPASLSLAFSIFSRTMALIKHLYS